MIYRANAIESLNMRMRKLTKYQSYFPSGIPPVLNRHKIYRHQAARDEDGVDALIDANRRKPNPKNRVEKVTESAVTAFALKEPAFRQIRVSNELRQRGIYVSPSGVRSVLLAIT